MQLNLTRTPHEIHKSIKFIIGNGTNGEDATGMAQFFLLAILARKSSFQILLRYRVHVYFIIKYTQIYYETCTIFITSSTLIILL